MIVSLNSGCNIRFRANVHLWKFISSSQGYQKYSRLLFYIYQKSSWETVLPSEAILRILRVYPLIVISSSSDYILKFLRGIYNISGCHAFS